MVKFLCSAIIMSSERNSISFFFFFGVKDRLDVIRLAIDDFITYEGKRNTAEGRRGEASGYRKGISKILTHKRLLEQF